MTTEIKIMSAGAVKVMVVALGADFERKSGTKSGIKLNLNFGTAGAQGDRIKAGEETDLIMLSQSGIAALDNLNLLKVGSAIDLASTVTGVIVRDGAPRPDISTPGAFKQALLAAPSVAWTDPKAGGSGGIMFAALLEKLGITEAINKKAVLCKGGYDVAAAVAEGRAALATTLISEALPVKGVTIVGPLPGELNFKNMYSAAIHAGSTKPEAAKAFLNFLTDKATRPRWLEAGMEPAF
ncbi:MAG: substrate-binding domain-containing protein [Pseudolabrys sp.]|nr:substrate-binding domain-containing protein [Pseudolabrys sp.]